jgi:hypothetical protein
MKNLSIILSFTMLLFVLSCKKDENTTPTKPKKDILVSKTWIISDVTGSGIIAFNKNNAVGTNLFELGKVTLIFKSDGTVTGTDNNGAAIAAKWTLSTDETKINITGSGITGVDGEKLILVLTETNFDIKGIVTIPTIGNVDATIKFIPK